MLGNLLVRFLELFNSLGTSCTYIDTKKKISHLVASANVFKLYDVILAANDIYIYCTHVYVYMCVFFYIVFYFDKP